VIVTDGFTGNVALKATEGAAKYIVAQIKASVSSSKRAALGALLLKPALKGMSLCALGRRLRRRGAARPARARGQGDMASTSSEAVKNGTLAVAEAVRRQACGQDRRGL